MAKRVIELCKTTWWSSVASNRSQLWFLLSWTFYLTASVWRIYILLLRPYDTLCLSRHSLVRFFSLFLSFFSFSFSFRASEKHTREIERNDKAIIIMLYSLFSWQTGYSQVLCHSVKRVGINWWENKKFVSLFSFATWLCYLEEKVSMLIQPE